MISGTHSQIFAALSMMASSSFLHMLPWSCNHKSGRRRRIPLSYLRIRRSDFMLAALWRWSLTLLRLRGSAATVKMQKSARVTFPIKSFWVRCCGCRRALGRTLRTQFLSARSLPRSHVWHIGGRWRGFYGTLDFGIYYQRPWAFSPSLCGTTGLAFT